MIDIRKSTADYMANTMDVSRDVVEMLFELGLMREDLARKVLIREEYFRKSSTRRKTDLKIHLSEKWAVSLSTVEKIIAERSRPR